MSERLSKTDWIRQGLITLGREGHNALKTGPMAARLNVSRGSFYWHFKDTSDFRSQVLRAWQEATTEQVIRELDARKGAPGGLALLLQRTFRPGRELERAVRAWAAEDPEAAGIVAAVDVRRVTRVERLLVEAGVAADRAPHRAAFLYWAYLGQSVVVEASHATIPPDAVDDIAGLFET
jgi:AcrR family transcriptional regulator